jgi:glucose-6-phosphate 1-dehydrogenase
MVASTEAVCSLRPRHPPLSLPRAQGLEFFPAETELNLEFKSRYPSRAAPEAYARLILDVLRGKWRGSSSET